MVGGLTGANCDIKTIKIVNEKGEKQKYIVSASNEVVNLTNIATGEVQYKIYDPEAIFGFVTCLETSGSLLAIGFSNGTVQVYNVEELSSEIKYKPFEMVHQFSLHKSAVSSVLFTDENTQMITGGQDSYIITYDLVGDTANYKLMGHKESISQL